MLPAVKKCVSPRKLSGDAVQGEETIYRETLSAKETSHSEETVHPEGILPTVKKHAYLEETPFTGGNCLPSGNPARPGEIHPWRSSFLSMRSLLHTALLSRWRGAPRSSMCPFLTLKPVEGKDCALQFEHSYRSAVITSPFMSEQKRIHVWNWFLLPLKSNATLSEWLCGLCLRGLEPDEF